MEPKQKINYSSDDTINVTWVIQKPVGSEPIDYLDLLEAFKKVKEWEKDEGKYEEEKWNPSKR